MKSIFITISRGIIVRNILQTGVVEYLVHAGHRVVLFTTASEIPAFRDAFVRPPEVTALPFPRKRWPRVDEIFSSLHRGLIYNRRTDLIAKVGQLHPSETNALKYWSYRAVFQPLSKIRPLRDLVRWLDIRLLPVTEYDDLFREEKPALLFSTNIMEYEDAQLAKAARRNGVPVIGMPKSWDNLSKTGFRVKPDRLIVWSPFMREEAKRFQNIPSERFDIVGVPQFDIYAHPERLASRADFCKEVGLDPAKRIVLYGSEGKVTPHDGEAVKMLVDAVRDGRLPRDVQFLVRPHYGYRNELKKFEIVKDCSEVATDTLNVPSEGFSDQWDWRNEHLRRLADSLYHCSVLVTSPSTLTLDATAFDKPVVNVAFDGYAGTLPYGYSMTHWYDTEHYAPIVESGVPTVARSETQLVDAVREALEYPERKAALRAAFRDRFCGPIDGHAAERIAALLHGLAGS